MVQKGIQLEYSFFVLYLLIYSAQWLSWVCIIYVQVLVQFEIHYVIVPCHHVELIAYYKACQRKN